MSSEQPQQKQMLKHTLPSTTNFLVFFSENYDKGYLIPKGESMPADGSPGSPYSFIIGTFLSVIRCNMGLYIPSEVCQQLLSESDIDPKILIKDYKACDPEKIDKDLRVQMYLKLTAFLEDARLELSQNPEYIVEGYHDLLASAVADAEARKYIFVCHFLI